MAPPPRPGTVAPPATAAASRPMRGRVLRLALRGLIALAVLFLSARVLARLDAEATARTILRASPWRLALALLAHIAHVAFKAARWRVLLRPVCALPPGRLMGYLLASNAAGAIAPTRVGDGVWVWLLSAREGVAPGVSVAALLVEKLFEGFGLAVLVAPLPWLLPLPRQLAWTAAALGFGGVAVSLFAVLLARSDRLQRTLARWAFWPRVAPALEALRDTPRALTCAALSVAGQLCDCVAVALLFGAAGVSAPWAAPALVILSLTAALTVPSTPASVGAFELAAMAPLEVLGVPPVRGIAFGVLFHALHVPLVLLGAALAAPLLWGRDRRAP